MKKYTNIFIAFCVVFLFSASSCKAAEKTKNIPSATEKAVAKASDFSLTLSNGEKVSFSSLAGKTVMLHFWATWCPPCRAELPGLNDFAKAVSPNGTESDFVFLAVCVSDSESSRADFMSKNGYSFLGGLDANGDVAVKYGVTGIPATFIISPEGNITESYVGAVPKSRLDSLLKEYARE